LNAIKNINSANLNEFTHVVFIPSSVEYYDRLIMFCELGLKFRNQYVYLNSGDIDRNYFKKKYPNANFVFSKKNANTVQKIISLFKFIKKIKSRHLIIHDLLIPRLALIHKFIYLLSSRIKAYYFISLYFPNTKYYKTRGWEKLKYPLSQKEKIHYVKMFKMRSFYERISTHIYDGIIGNSSDITDGIIHWYKFPNNQTAVIPTAIDISIINKIKKNITKKNRGGKSILYVGSIQPRKEVELVIEAVSVLINKYKLKCSLHIVGAYHTKRERAINNLILKNNINKYIEFHGHVNADKLYSFYNNADCFVFPSRWEGSPRAIKEALAFNLPVVAADIPGNRLIDQNGMFINYVEKQNPQNYAELINAVIHKKRNKPFTYIDLFKPENIAYLNYQFYKSIVY
jgi:glycosyltransferase involved in cell wall biosynthesis